MSQIHNLENLQIKIDEALVFFQKKLVLVDLKKINLLLLEEIKIDYFSAKTAIRYLVNAKKGNEGEYYLFPFDHKLLTPIYNAINDYQTPWRIALHKDKIVLNLPIITSEKKAKILKNLKSELENCRILIRGYRQNFLNYCKNILELSYSDLQLKQKEIQKIVETANQKAEMIFQKFLTSLQKV